MSNTTMKFKIYDTNPIVSRDAGWFAERSCGDTSQEEAHEYPLEELLDYHRSRRLTPWLSECCVLYLCDTDEVYTVEEFIATFC